MTKSTNWNFGDKKTKKHREGIMWLFVPAILIIYLVIRSYYIRIDDLGINQGVSHMSLLFYTLPGKIILFYVAGGFSLYIADKFKKLPKMLYYILPFALVTLVFLLDLDFYHWDFRDYPLGRNLVYINRSVFWTHLLP